MNRSILLTALATSFGFASLAATPLATMYSPQAFTVDGHSVSAPGVSSSPIVIGDEIATSNAEATILFQDGSNITLAPKSSARLTGTNAHPKLLLVAGRLEYKLVPGTALELSNSAPATQGGGDARSRTPAAASAGVATAGMSSMSTGGVVAGVLVGAGAIAVIPIANAAQGSPSNLPPISAP